MQRVLQCVITDNKSIFTVRLHRVHVPFPTDSRTERMQPTGQKSEPQCASLRLPACMQPRRVVVRSCPHVAPGAATKSGGGRESSCAALLQPRRVTDRTAPGRGRARFLSSRDGKKCTQKQRRQAPSYLHAECLQQLQLFLLLFY